MTNLAMRPALVLLGLVAVFALQMHPQNPAPGKPAGKDVYQGLRNLALTGSRAKLGLPATSEPTDPWGIMMDWGVTRGTATVVAFSDGSASIYLSSGGGFLGGQAHESIRNAAKAMVAAAARCRHQAHAVTSYPLPQQGEVAFYFLTDAGVFTASAPQDALSSHRHPLSELGEAAQAVIAQYRLITQKAPAQ